MVEPEWIVFYASIDELIEHGRKASKFIGLHYPESEERDANPKTPM
jgi:hypothetical protein